MKPPVSLFMAEVISLTLKFCTTDVYTTGVYSFQVAKAIRQND